ncbi:MAG TPA: efflux RND transporter periplasmic adaptor subunit [Bacteroidota bacterium]|nr:efflux RND transporter periplasmic adaptor subunit [Bacteroidota bacterium]
MNFRTILQHIDTGYLDKALKFVPNKYRNKKFGIPFVAAVVLVILFIGFSSSNKESVATADVRRGEFRISIKSSGEIRAANSFTLTTPRVRYGQMQIVYLIPEGTTVKAGDVIVRFASTDVDKTIADKEAELSINKSDLDKFKADKDLRLSELDGNLRNAELSYEQAKLQVEKMKFEADVQKKEAEINLERNRISYDQAKKKVESQGSVDKSEERKIVLKVQQTQNDLDRAKKDKEQYTLKATLGGLAVYENNWSTGRKVAVGDSPWGGMALVSLPDLSKMQSVTNVNEVDVSKVKKDQKVKIKLDAFPEKEFMGNVLSVGTIGQQRDQSNTKTFEVIVDIDGVDPVLKPGMTTSNEVIMSSISDTLFVPIEAVFEKDGKTIVYKGSRAQEVTLGAKNSNFVVVSGGLAAGDKIALRDPNAALTTQQGQEKKL